MCSPNLCTGNNFNLSTEILSFVIHLSYEGTGRSLSLKLLQQLEEQSRESAKTVEGSLSGMIILHVSFCSVSQQYACKSPRMLL